MAAMVVDSICDDMIYLHSTYEAALNSIGRSPLAATRTEPPLRLLDTPAIVEKLKRSGSLHRLARKIAREGRDIFDL